MRKQLPKTRKYWEVRFEDGHFFNGEHTGRATCHQYLEALRRKYENKHPARIVEIEVHIIKE